MQDENNLIDQTLVERATQLVPLLRRHAREAEQQRRLPEEVVTALKATGMLSMYKPRRHGGLEARLSTAVEAWTELGRGCGSTSWVVGQLNNTMLLACLFLPQTAREELFAQPEVYIASVFVAKDAVARRVPGGYTLDGAWPYCSGCLHASWILVFAPIEGAPVDAPPAMFLIPASQMEIQDDWHAVGLCATGSNTVIAKGVFVPEARVGSTRHMLNGEPLHADYEGPLYHAAFTPLMLLGSAAPSLGMAREALDELKAQVPGRGIAYTTYAKRSEAPLTHLRFAEATAKVDTAELLVRQAAAQIERLADRRQPMDLETRLKLRVATSHAIHLCREAVDLIFDMGGASALSLSNPLQRILRDVRAHSMHAAYACDVNLESYGRVQLGLASNMFFA
jgi:3-hydroxy-9,10-secoandrosta-1,3,5(10)-triene-9,17-dione monooxygenase